MEFQGYILDKDEFEFLTLDGDFWLTFGCILIILTLLESLRDPLYVPKKLQGLDSI